MGSSSIKIILLLLFSLRAMAQSPGVSGNVKDAAKNPVAFADVVLLQVQDSAVYKATLTTEAGRFAITGITPGNYILKISALGFADYKKPIAIEGATEVSDVILNETAKELNDVVINSKRPVVRRKIDRLEFDVENSILSSDNAWEILKKTPGVTVGMNGLSIRGSSGILVTINDKKVYLTGTELKNLLENTNGEDIKSVEVITTPPAKYEAQGSAVLNIKMKKNGSKGYKASLSGAYVQTMYPKGVVSTNHYYKNNKFSVYGGYMFGSGHYYNESDTEVRYSDAAGNTQSIWKSREEANYRATSQNSYNLTAEYQLDTLNTVNVGVNGFFSLKSTAHFDGNTSIYGAGGQLDSIYTTHNHRDYPQKNNTINGSFEHKFTDKNKLTFSSDFTRHYFNQDQGVLAAFSLPGLDPYRINNIISGDTRRISLFSAQADFNGEKEGYTIEAGLRYGLVNAKNQFSYLNDSQSDMAMDNRFLYDESVFAGYTSLNKEFGKWSLQAGLRGEYTHLKGNSVTTAEVNKQNYFKVFPTLYAMYKANDNNQIGLSYGKRIIRPQYSALNPFRLYANPYAYSTGDPRLQPAISHNFSLLYTLKEKYNFDVYYNYEKKPSMEITYQDYATSTLVTQFTNIKDNRALGLSFNTNIDVFAWWQQGWQADVSYLENTFQGPDGGFYTNKKWNASTSLNNRFNLSRKKDWLAEANFFYQSASVQGTNNYGQISSLSMSLKKIFWEGKAELAVIFSDIYKGQRQTITTRYANQYSYTDNYADTQTFRLQFRYRFGNQKLEGKTARQDSEEKGRL
ncbi:TonB-dependent receptor [Flavobacterium subsaxonicum]|uniref:Outer membrane protein beta-barrel domain-containing protein n=1 Tax=Flavobacterium subsaxonicum WB 4.1-42 = DSM 21790 TaxID=1121898 RepID=A0A0A2MNJ0_9FLAO|nr:TonB-dependent receptor [Flavobacterium subsaxonicum]KGO94212.1 hypothetical protein Q766_04600 [Flavobacterium subsaxonicum WB 4.1-42 = DSM 21790]